MQRTQGEQDRYPESLEKTWSASCPRCEASGGVTCLSHLCPDCLLPSADQICLLWSENQRLWSLIKMSECLQLKINEIHIVSSRFLPCFLGFLDNCLHSVPLPSSKSSPDLFSKHQPIDSFLNVPQVPGLSQSSSPLKPASPLMFPWLRHKTMIRPLGQPRMLDEPSLLGLHSLYCR